MDKHQYELGAVHTPLGYLYGRDAIYVDKVDYELNDRKVTLTGEFNGALGSESKSDDFIGYTLRFEGVYYFKATELDLHGDYLPTGPVDIKSDWLEYRQSALLEQAQKKGKASLKELRHFVLFTYDDVFEIGCRSYELELHPRKSSAE